MEPLQLLSLVIPALGALAKRSLERSVQDKSLLRDNESCYSDIISIGQALSISGGEWSPSLEQKVIDRLLQAIQSRIPKQDGVFRAYTPTQSKSIDALAKSILEKDLGGYNECATLIDHTDDRTRLYLTTFHSERTYIFHSSERTSEKKRKKFLTLVKEAATHLMNVYFKTYPGSFGEEISLAQHPSRDVKDVSNMVYGLLTEHWQCQCQQRSRSREARISLSKHQNLALRVLSTNGPSNGQLSTEFEVLLPVCRDEGEWKVTNVKAIQQASIEPQSWIRTEPVQNDICQWILKYIGHHVGVLIKNDTLWYQESRLSNSPNCHTTMETLQQLLGNGISTAPIATYTPKEKLALCYILANSMLLFYPGTWLHSSWDSNRVHFVRRMSGPRTVALTMPYLSTEIHQRGNTKKTLKEYHPEILALGIIFLEIITGVKFKRRPAQNEPEQNLSDSVQAWIQLQELANSPTGISQALRGAISACIQQDPPPNSSSTHLSEEGPVRHYILSCIVQPLAIELVNGHKMKLEDLHNPSIPVADMREPSAPGVQESFPRPKPPAPSPGYRVLPNAAEPQRWIGACPRARGEFEIAIVCALRTEYDAAALAFDQFWDDDCDPYGKAPGDPNAYTTGRIGQYNVVLTLLPEMGKVSAASATAGLRSSYTGIKLAILTGICGGVPNLATDNEIVLGDVVISTSIVRYDYGKQYPQGFVRKDAMNDNLGRHTPEIRSFLNTLQTERLLDRLQRKSEECLAHIQDQARRGKQQSPFDRPASVEDRLFAPDYEHRHQNRTDCCSCNNGYSCKMAQAASCDELGCDTAKLVRRDRLDQNREDGTGGRRFDIFFGQIGSADTVMKSGSDRDRIARQENIIAFEMEGAGVWDGAPCIVIKGVCDYADSHKDKKWQAYAAATAASVMKALLARFTTPDKPAGDWRQGYSKPDHPTCGSSSGDGCHK